MYNYPLPQDIPAAKYFLQDINQPVWIMLIRVLLGLIAVVFVLAYIRIKMKKKTEEKDK
jgi:hypothetical protein